MGVILKVKGWELLKISNHYLFALSLRIQFQNSPKTRVQQRKNFQLSGIHPRPLGKVEGETLLGPTLYNRPQREGNGERKKS